MQTRQNRCLIFTESISLLLKEYLFSFVVIILDQCQRKSKTDVLEKIALL